VIREDTLTAEQRTIADAPLEGPYVVDAGAGTGKTYTLVRRAVRLVETQTLRADELLVVTFTKKASNEIAERLTLAFEDIGVYNLPTCETFHSLAAGLLREFAYVTGDSPDLRAIDDVRARGLFRRAYADLLAGNLGVDLSALPILDREDVLIHDLATLAFSLKNEGTSVDRFEREALAAASSLRCIPFGQTFLRGKKGGRTAAIPKRERTPAERVAEADREATNVRAVAALLRHFDMVLTNEGVLTYGDLLTRAIAMFEDYPIVAERIRRRWRHALVDEFQDTNPQQLAFLRAIFGYELRPVMAAGDVRQAIYEWNGADPLGIVNLKNLPGTTTLPLTLNRRSYREILEAAHIMLPKGGSIDWGEPLRAHLGQASHPVIRPALFEDGGNVAERRECEARAIAAEIAALLADGQRPRDIAILLRSRPAARTYANALRDLGIASRTHGGVGFFDAPEIVDALAWFRLALDPSDRTALARVLQSPAAAFSDGTVARLFARTDDRSLVFAGSAPPFLDSAETLRFERVRSTLAIIGRAVGLRVTDAVRTLVRETAIDAARIATNQPAAAQIQANIAKLVSLADGFAQDRPLARLADFLAEIDERASLEDDEAEAELGGDEVAIMTIHAAKGLEWNHVFVANVSSGTFPSTRGAGEVTVMRDGASRALAFRYGVDGQTPLRWTLRAPHDRETGERPQTPPRDHSEERRLIYVAVTRAKRCVWISGVLSNWEQPSDFLAELLAHAEGGGRAACRAFPDPKPRVASDPAPRKPLTQRRELPDLARLNARLMRQPSLFEPWRGKLSYTAIATFKTCPRQARFRYALHVPDFREAPDVELADIDEPSGYRRTIDSATYGNIVHRVLEWAARATLDGRPYQLATLVDDALAEFESDGDAPLRDRVLTATERSLDVLSDYTAVGAEVEFDATIAGTSIGGFVDLITKDAAGVIWIVDYKTGRIPDDAFALQLALYRIALRPKYPNVRLAILRIADDGVSLIEPSVPPDTTIEQIVGDAAAMDRDEPHPGPQCGTCPYAGPLCPEGHASLR
jgi:DNA helicase-2/ATP-dependent DNA helicase PcrA